jgi:hypothetical protein
MRLMLPRIACFYIFWPYAVLAQLVEHLICNQAVSSSSLLDGSTFKNSDLCFSTLLWASIIRCSQEGFFMTTREVYRTFMDDRRVNGLTDKTLSYYGETVGKFVDFCEDCDLMSATRQINAYFLSLQDRGLAQNSIRAVSYLCKNGESCCEYADGFYPTEQGKNLGGLKMRRIKLNKTVEYLKQVDFCHDTFDLEDGGVY